MPVSGAAGAGLLQQLYRRAGVEANQAHVEDGPAGGIHNTLFMLLLHRWLLQEQFDFAIGSRPNTRHAGRPRRGYRPATQAGDSLRGNRYLGQVEFNQDIPGGNDDRTGASRRRGQLQVGKQLSIE